MRKLIPNVYKLLGSKDISEIQKAISDVCSINVSVGEALADTRMIDDVRDDIARLRNRIKQIKMENGIFVEPNPSKKDYDSEYPWYDGISWGAVRSLCPNDDDGAYGIHAWLVSIGAVTEKTSQDHEYGMICYRFKTKAEIISFAKRINKVLSKLYTEKKIRQHSF